MTIFNHSTREAQASRTLRVQGQPGTHQPELHSDNRLERKEYKTSADWQAMEDFII